MDEGKIETTGSFEIGTNCIDSETTDAEISVPSDAVVSSSDTPAMASTPDNEMTAMIPATDDEDEPPINTSISELPRPLLVNPSFAFSYPDTVTDQGYVFQEPQKEAPSVGKDKKVTIIHPPCGLTHKRGSYRMSLFIRSLYKCRCGFLVDRWVALTEGLRESINRVVLAVTDHAARNPYTYLISITVLSFVLLGTGFATNFDMSRTAAESYTAKSSVLHERKEWVDSISGFPAPPLSIRAVVHANGDSVLTQEGVDRVFQVVETVTHTPGYELLCSSKHHYPKEEDGYAGGYSTKCHVRGISLLWNNSRSIMQEHVGSDADIWMAVASEKYPDGSEVHTPEILGRAKHHYQSIVGAETLLIEVMLPGMHSHSANLAQDVLKQMLDLRQEWYDDLANHYLLEVFMAESLESETTRAVMKDLPLIPIVFVIMALFTCAIFSSNDSGGSADDSQKSSSRVLLGVGAVFCVVLSLASSYGLLYIIGIPFTSVTQILPFVMFGIGLDDSFIIFGEFNRTDRRKDPVERIHDTFEEIGLSIVLTKLTTTVAFGLGCLSDYPTMYWLSLYAFPTVIFDAVYQVTFFVAAVVLDERRIAANRRDCCICCTVGGVDGKDAFDNESLGSSLSYYSSTTSQEEGREEQNNDAKFFLRDSESEQPRSRVDRFMGWYSNQLLRPSVKVVVLLAFLFVTAGLAYSATLFRQEFDLRDVLPGDSFVRDYLITMEKHGERGWIIPSAYFRNVDQSDPDVQDQMEAYVNDLVDSLDSISAQPPFFWLRHFRLFLSMDDRLPPLNFKDQMDIFLSIDHFKMLYGDHIIRDPETGAIIASRCVLYMDNVDLNSVQSQQQAWEDINVVSMRQEINKEHGSEEELSFFLYEPTMLYIWEFYTHTVGELATSTVLGVIAVGIIGFVLIPNWTATLYLMPIIAILYVDMIGFLQLFEVNLNAVSYFSLIMSIGLLVDFNMHILLKYYESHCTSREAKVKDALQTMGSSVLIGGFSTFLGVLPLFFSSSEIMLTLFFGFVGMVLLGCSHGLILLPVILSIFGPEETIGTKKSVASVATRGRFATLSTSPSGSFYSDGSRPAGGSITTISTCSNGHPTESDKTQRHQETYDTEASEIAVGSSLACGEISIQYQVKNEEQGETVAATEEHISDRKEEEGPPVDSGNQEARGVDVVSEGNFSEELKCNLDDCVLMPTEDEEQTIVESAAATQVVTDSAIVDNCSEELKSTLDDCVLEPTNEDEAQPISIYTNVVESAAPTQDISNHTALEDNSSEELRCTGNLADCVLTPTEDENQPPSSHTSVESAAQDVTDHAVPDSGCDTPGNSAQEGHTLCSATTDVPATEVTDDAQEPESPVSLCSATTDVTPMEVIDDPQEPESHVCGEEGSLPIPATTGEKELQSSGDDLLMTSAIPEVESVEGADGATAQPVSNVAACEVPTPPSSQECDGHQSTENEPSGDNNLEPVCFQVESTELAKPTPCIDGIDAIDDELATEEQLSVLDAEHQDATVSNSSDGADGDNTGRVASDTQGAPLPPGDDNSADQCESPQEQDQLVMAQTTPTSIKCDVPDQPEAILETQTKGVDHEMEHAVTEETQNGSEETGDESVTDKPREDNIGCVTD